jgi:hypothetical protein
MEKALCQDGEGAKEPECGGEHQGHAGHRSQEGEGTL